MKTQILLVACLLLIGCRRHEENHREVLGKLDALESALTNRPVAAVRWAYANKREIDGVVTKWRNEQVEAFKKTETLSPNLEEKMRIYEALEGELGRKRIDRIRYRMPSMPFPPPGYASPVSTNSSAEDREFEALSKKVAEARVPVAAILDRRNEQSAQYGNQHSTEKLIAEYAKDRFDVIIDSSDDRFSRSVIYHTNGEVIDITDGIIRLFKEQTKQ